MAEGKNTISEGQKAAFNPAVAYVESLASLLNRFDGMMLIEQYKNAYLIAERIYSRIEHKLSDKEKEVVEDLIDKIEERVFKITNSNITELIKTLRNIDRTLKRNMDDYGLLIPSKEDPRFAILRR